MRFFSLKYVFEVLISSFELEFKPKFVILFS